MAAVQISFIDNRPGARPSAAPIINVGDVVDIRVGLAGEGALLKRITYTGDPAALTFDPGADTLFALLVSLPIVVAFPLVRLRVKQVEPAVSLTWLVVKE